MATIFEEDVEYTGDVIFRGNIECKGDVTCKKDITVYGTLTTLDHTCIESFDKENTFLNRLKFLFTGK